MQHNTTSSEHRRSRVPGWAALAVAAAGCVADEPELATVQSAIQVLGCTVGVEGIGPARCRTVPPVNKVPGAPGWAPFVIDGVQTPTEYWGAVEFPYANIRRKLAGGRVLVNATSDLRRLHVYLDDLPGSITGELRVYLDYRRFQAFADGDPAFGNVATEDRAIGLDLATGAVRKLAPSMAGGTLHWATLAGPVDYAARRGAVTGTGNQMRFDAEFMITLDPLMSDAAGRPGVGFAVAQVPPENPTSTGAFPEELVIDGFTATPGGLDPIPAMRPHDLNRREFQTLVFASPTGIPLRFMTWNVKRFTDFMSISEALFASGAFPDGVVDPAAIGRHIAPFDVVALQEAWDASEAQAIRTAANTVRTAAGVAPFELYGPIDFAKTDGISFDATTGGLYILSPHPITTMGMDIFKDCRGEDCLKAKGVLHVRLLIDRTTSSPENGPARSVDNFVDVYTTHLQADQMLCAKLSSVKDWINGILAGLNPLLSIGARFLVELITDHAFHCDDFADDAAVRAAQLVQMNGYIQSTADATRPSIVLGDFNIDGRRLGLSSPEYGPMLDTLGLGPTSMAPGAPAPEDWLTPWRDAAGFAWDIDHADLGRQRFNEADWLGAGHGTFIGTDGLDDPSGSPPRLDYIFVRPPARPGTAAFDRQSWTVARDTGAVWASPFEAELGVPTIGNRLSDHKPVISSLKLVQMRFPDRYHATWPHHLELRVKEANASGNTDCIFGICGGLDLYSKRKTVVVPVAGASTIVGPTTMMECSGEGSVLTFNTSACMRTWGAAFDHVPGTQRKQGAGNDLWEADTSPNPDDHYRTVWNDNAAIFSIDWVAGQVELRRFDVPGVAACVDGFRDHAVFPPADVCTRTWTNRAVADNTPQGTCTRHPAGESVPFLCYELAWTETPPPP